MRTVFSILFFTFLCANTCASKSIIQEMTTLTKKLSTLPKQVASSNFEKKHHFSNNCYFSTHFPDVNYLKLSINPHETADLKYTLERGEPKLSPLDSQHYDALAQKLLGEGQERPGIPFRILESKQDVEYQAKMIDHTKTLVSSEGLISIVAHRVKLKTLYRTPEEILFSSPKGKSLIYDIIIKPRLYKYKIPETSDFALSQTTCVMGEIDFSKNKLDLEIYNGLVEILFDNKGLFSSSPKEAA